MKLSPFARGMLIIAAVATGVAAFGISAGALGWANHDRPLLRLDVAFDRQACCSWQVWVDGEVSVAPAGSFVYGPRGLPHTFIVSSEVARFLLVTEPAGFERFTRALGQPAERREIPPPATDPPDVDGLAKLAATFGLQIVGPPGIPA